MTKIKEVLLRKNEKALALLSVGVGVYMVVYATLELISRTMDMETLPIGLLGFMFIVISLGLEMSND